MGKKKIVPKQSLRKNSNGMVWPQQQIPMHEVSIENNENYKWKQFQITILFRHIHHVQV